MELMAGVRGCVFDGPQDGLLGAAAATAANARIVNFIVVIVTSRTENKRKP
jgi:hypothetical protein